jgi:hypothetical protein
MHDAAKLKMITPHNLAMCAHLRDRITFARTISDVVLHLVSLQANSSALKLLSGAEPGKHGTVATRPNARQALS